MDTPLSLNYIESALQKGESEEQIRNKLRSQGVSEEQINDAFAHLKNKHDFLSSNVASHPGTEGNKSSVLPQSSISPHQPIPTKPIQPSSFSSLERSGIASRMKQSAAAKENPLGVIITIVALLFLGAGAAGYYYFDDIMNFLSETPTQSFQSQQPSVVPTTTPSVEKPAAPTAGEEEQSQEVTADALKVEQVNKIKDSALSYFSANGVYPRTVEGVSGDVFYCYRKNGSHFIAGAVLDDINDPAAKEALSNDLDGDYYCGLPTGEAGDTIKHCADPTYCVGP